MNDRNDHDIEDQGPQGIDLAELGDNGPTDTVACPACGADIYQDADRCDVCGEYIVRRGPSHSLWVWATLGLAVLAIAFCLLWC